MSVSHTPCRLCDKANIKSRHSAGFYVGTLTYSIEMQRFSLLVLLLLDCHHPPLIEAVKCATALSVISPGSQAHVELLRESERSFF